jgi:sulfate transport system substrate-binding protein
VTVVDKVAQTHGNVELATEYLTFLYSPTGQRLAAKHYFRPALPEHAEPTDLTRFSQLELLTIDQDFGGWQSTQAKHFDDGGTFDQIYDATGR